MSKLDDLSAWRVFASLCKTRNFSDSASEFDVEVSTISRAISSLENSLGQEFFIRSTRPLQLTENGVKALEHIEPILQLHQEMMTELHSGSAALNGKIRLSLAPGFVTRFLMPMLMDFNSMYPSISFDIVGGGNVHDILQYTADIAVVSFKSTDSRLVFIPRGRNVYVPVASPQYIANHGYPTHPKELADHTLLLYDGSVRAATKELVNGNERYAVSWNKVARIANILAIKRSVMDGLGVSIDLPLLHCCSEIISGELVPILPGWVNPPVECFIATSKSNWRVRRHRVFIQWFQKKLHDFFAEKEELVRPFWTPPSFTVVHER